jgi:transposase-like protein
MLSRGHRRYGMEHGLQRYRCVGCGRTFNALTGTCDCWGELAKDAQHSFLRSRASGIRCAKRHAR